MQQQGQQQAIQQAMQFLGMGQQQQQLLGSLGGLAQQLGQHGAPNMNAILQGFMAPGAQAGGMDPGVMQLLGMLFQRQGQGGASPAAQPAAQGPAQQLPAVAGVGA
jgi:hypothetical protein